MIYKHMAAMPNAYSLEWRGDGNVNIWLCRQIDTYITADGSREYDMDVRVIIGVENYSELESDICARWDHWWNMATAEACNG